MASKMKICKHCGAEIAASAKVCPNCGGKNPKPIFKRVWFWILIAIVVIGICGVAGSGGDSDTATPASSDTQNEEQAQSESIEYTPITVGELNDALENNPAAASDEYKGKYVEVTGKLNNIDSDGSYISLTDPNDEWDIIGVMCYIQNDEQLAAVKQMSMEQEVTVKGKITDVGEVIGYAIDIDSIE